MIAAPLMLVSSGAISPVAAAAPNPPPPANATTRIAGPQHWCGTNGITCAEPALMWSELAGFDQAMKAGAHISGYIGHDEPATLFYSPQPGSGNNVTYRMRLPVDPPTRPRQNGSGGTDSFQLPPTFWLGMVMCDDQGSPNPDGATLTGHPTIPCKPDSDSNIFESQDPNSPRYFGLGPGQAYEEMQFYPPGWAPWPAGIGCTANQWCAALNIDTFSENENTGQLNNTACLNTVGPEPVNFAFVTKNGVATAPANPQHPEHFVPDPKRDFLMRSGDNITVHLFDTPSGLRVVIQDLTTHTRGSMTASAANGFGNVVFDPSATTCQVNPYNFHPEFSTSTPQTRPGGGRASARLGGAGRAGPSGSRAPGGRMPRSDGAGGQQKRDSNPGNSLRPFHGVLLEGMQDLDAPAAVAVPSCPGPRALLRTASLAQDREPCSGSRAVPRLNGAPIYRR